MMAHEGNIEFDTCELCAVTVTDDEEGPGSFLCGNCGHIFCSDCACPGQSLSRPLCNACEPADAR